MALLSLLTLITLIILGSVIEINIGIVAIACTFMIGFFADGLGVKEIVSGFPSSLFLTLFGITLLFSHAQLNGTLERITNRIIFLFRGNIFWIPICFFLLTLSLSAIGAGNIASTALVAPAAMASAKKLKISPFLMAIMVINGANAGGLSPIAPTGIIAAERMTQIGLTNLSWSIFFNSLIVHIVIACGGYLIFGGYKLFISKKDKPSLKTVLPEEANATFEGKHWITLSIILALFISVVWLKVDIIIGAFIGAALMSVFRVSDERKALKNVPWGIIVMVCGISMFTILLDRTGGLNLFTDYMARFCNEQTIIPVIGFFAAMVSVYSSSSGVVLPTFLLLIPQLTAKIPGADPVAIASTISVSAHLVDVSPLSTVGALCLAAVNDVKDNRLLFNKMLIWGLSMTVVAAVFSYIFF